MTGLNCKSAQVINRFGNESNKDNLYAFSYTSLMDIMKNFSNISVTRVVLGYVLMVSVSVVRAFSASHRISVSLMFCPESLWSILLNWPLQTLTCVSMIFSILMSIILYGAFLFSVLSTYISFIMFNVRTVCCVGLFA